MRTLKITLITCLFAITIKAQTVHTVDNRSQSGAQYTTVQAAVDAAVAGDIIQIHPSLTTYGAVTINKTLSLIGIGHGPTAHDQGITAKITTLNFSGSSVNSEVKGLSISLITTLAPLVDIDNIHIVNNNINSIKNYISTGLTDNWIIEGNYLTETYISIYMYANGALIKNNFMLGAVGNSNASCLITNNIFFSTSSTAIDYYFYNCTGTIVSNNIFVASVNTTTFGLSNSTNLDFRNNLTYSYNNKVITALPGINNLNNTNPMFVSVPTGTESAFYDNDYHLATGSTGINYGTDATDIGVYGSSFLFDTQGIPRLIPHPISITINNNVLAAGQNLSVNFSAVQK